MIYLDFETRSECDIFKAGAWVYSADPSTSVLCMAYAVDDGEVALWTPDSSFPIDQWLQQKIDEGHTFEAHNAFFEKSIWQNVMAPRYGWPIIPEDQWACSAAQAAAHSLPRALGKCGEALGLKTLKSDVGRRVMLKMCKPRRAKKSEDPNGVYWHEDAEDFKTLYAYCIDDVKAERAISQTLMPLNQTEREVWKLDQRINLRGVRIDMDAVKAAIHIAGEHKTQSEGKLAELTGGIVMAASETLRIKAWVEDQGVPLTNMTKGTVTAVLDTLIPQDVRDVLTIRQQGSKTSISKYQALLHATAKDDRVRDLLMYCGAGTGRWSGKLVQPQNLPRNKFKDDLELYFEVLKEKNYWGFELCYPEVMDTLSHCIRPCFISSEGEDFFGGDYSAIEPRVLFWLCGQEDGLEMFRNDEDIYLNLANIIYKTDNLTKANTEERMLGKQAVLGCGYGMGAPKFQVTCEGYGMDVSEEVAKSAVDTYRTSFHEVPTLWHEQERAAMMAVSTGKSVRCGKILWAVHESFLFCKLPSGRCIAYYQPAIQDVKTPWGAVRKALTYMNQNSMTRKWERCSTYGGKLVENMTQGIARDIMAEAMLRCEDAGYKIVLTVHDELLTERSGGSVVEFEELMSANPPWADGLPTVVEGWSGKRYLK